MNGRRSQMRFESMGSPATGPHSIAGLSGREDSEIDALLEGFFTDRSDASTSRETARSGFGTGRTIERDEAKGQASSLHELGAAVDLAYADYIVQQRDFETPTWSKHDTDEAGEETRRSLPTDEELDYRFDGATEPNGEFNSGLSLDLNLEDVDNRVVQFDVGGRVFRCKASVINKYPGKRLFRIIDGGYDRYFGTDTFFIDRNARNFEVILDWYRTGKVFLGLGVDLEELGEDARYFDIYDEMFPANADSNSARALDDDSSGPFRFCRRERKCLLPTSVPVVYRIRAHEQLVVGSVQGHGKLMVRVCDPSGMQVVHVDQAVLFDSKARFYLDGARACLPLNALLPGDYVYTMWVEPHAEEAARVKGRATALDVEIQLHSTYSKSDLVGPDESSLQCSGQETARLEEQVTRDALVTQQPLLPTLFLPPFMQALYEDTGELDTLGLGKGKHLAARGGAQHARQNLIAASPKPKINFVARAAAIPKEVARQGRRTNQATDSPSSPIRRTGAAIVSPSKSVRRQEGTITIHRPDKLDFVRRG